MNRSTEVARGRIFVGSEFWYEGGAENRGRLTIEDILPDGQIRFRVGNDEDFQWVGIRDAVELIATGVWA